MALSEKLWSLNALSVELGIDRRTLSKKLADLPPVVQKQYGNRIEKKWLLKSVVKHLNRPKRRRSPPIDIDAEVERMANDPELERETLEMLKNFVRNEVYPKLCDCPNFINFIVNAFNEEFGLSAKQGLQAYQLVCLAITIGLCIGFNDEDIDFMVPETFNDLKGDGLDKLAAEWKFPPPE